MAVKLRWLQEMINGLIDYFSEQLPRIVLSKWTITKFFKNNWQEYLDVKEKKPLTYIFIFIFQGIFFVSYFCLVLWERLHLSPTGREDEGELGSFFFFFFNPYIWNCSAFDTFIGWKKSPLYRLRLDAASPVSHRLPLILSQLLPTTLLYLCWQ